MKRRAEVALGFVPKLFRRSHDEAHRNRNRDSSSTQPEPEPSIASISTASDTPPIEQGANIGLKLLYQPVNPRSARVDIIFVHGLTGNAFNTWYQKEKGVHWPSALLKDDVPEARIFSFGYDANVASFWGGASQNRLVHHAENLVGQLSGEREDTNTENRTTIFVVHSLGGLVIKRALQVSENNAESHLQPFEKSTAGILFLGTPHCGSDFAPYAKAVGNTLRLVGKRVNVEILDTLKRDSQTLLDVEAWFGHWRRRRADAGRPVQMTCFFEELELPVVGKVVENFQASISGYSSYGIHANHMDMTKFASADDPGYKAVRREIQRWTKGAGKKAAVDTQRENLRDKFLAKLYTCPYEDRKNVNRDHVPGTCQWFTNHELFKYWHESKGSRLLWVSADPGSGKSVLAKYLVNQVLPRQGRTVCYFFFKDGFPDQQSGLIAICSILRQLLLQIPHLLDDEILRRCERDGESLFQSISSLWELFTSAAAHEDAEEIVCVLDALDECQQDDFLKLSSEIRRLFLGANISNLKLLLTSRPYQHIQWEFGELEDRMPKIHLSGEDEVEVEKITKEIDLVIQSRVQAIGRKRRLHETERSHLLNLLTAVPNRTYLWVTLTLEFVERIRGFTRGNVIKAVTELPQTVDEAYSKILERSPDSTRALKALQIVTAAAWPLSVEEMSIAMTIEEQYKTYDQIVDQLEPKERFKDTLRDLCGLFLVTIGNKLYLLHQTAREFLVCKDGCKSCVLLSDPRRPSTSWKHSIMSHISNRVLAQACLRYLLSDLAQHTQTGVFDRYAFGNWDIHLRKSDIGKEDTVIQAALIFCQRISERSDSWPRFREEIRRRLEYDPPRDNFLVVASFLGIHQVVELLAGAVGALEDATVVSLNLTTASLQTAMSWAAKLGHTRTVQALIIYGGVNPDGSENELLTPLQQAAQNGHAEVVALLLETERVDVNVQGMFADSPLTLAASHGHSAVVKLLLEIEELEIDAKSPFGETALMKAAKEGHEEVVGLLLDTGKVDVNTATGSGYTALRYAMEQGHEGTIKLLVRAGGGNGDAFLRAISYGPRILRLLLDSADVDVNVRDRSGDTALIWAARKGLVGVVRFLLDAASVDAAITGSDGMTALSIVSSVVAGFEGRYTYNNAWYTSEEKEAYREIKALLQRYTGTEHSEDSSSVDSLYFDSADSRSWTTGFERPNLRVRGLLMAPPVRGLLTAPER